MGIPLEPGALVADRYRLESFLGQGGMGAVWGATHVLTGRAVALKFVRGPAHVRPQMRQRLLREARAASAVQHPNVVEILDAFEHDEDTPVMVMERLTGETLRQRLARDELLSLRETAAMLLPVVSAVGTAHELGVIHRDLKPDNVFLAKTAQGVSVRVLDFGIAKLAEVDGTADGTATVTGATLGTPCYMAPEQALGEKDIDHRADVWALGVILYECLSGVRPIEGDTVGQIVMHLMTTGITPVEHLVDDLPEDVAALVGRMLSRERSRRPRDLVEVFRVLARHTDGSAPSFGPPDRVVEDGADESGTAPLATDRPEPPRRTRPRWLLPALGLAATAATLAMVSVAAAPSRPVTPPSAEALPRIAPPPAEPLAEPRADQAPPAPTTEPRVPDREAKPSLPKARRPAPRRELAAMPRVDEPVEAPPALPREDLEPAGLAEEPPF